MFSRLSPHSNHCRSSSLIDEVPAAYESRLLELVLTSDLSKHTCVLVKGLAASTRPQPLSCGAFLLEQLTRERRLWPCDGDLLRNGLSASVPDRARSEFHFEIAEPDAPLRRLNNFCCRLALCPVPLFPRADLRSLEPASVGQAGSSSRVFSRLSEINQIL